MRFTARSVISDSLAQCTCEIRESLYALNDKTPLNLSDAEIPSIAYRSLVLIENNLQATCYQSRFLPEDFQWAGTYALPYLVEKV
jgi:hypothetical protein